MNPVVHFEMPYQDPERMASFYESAFSWKMQHLGAEMDNYILAITTETDAMPGSPAGAINGGFYPNNPDLPAQHPSIVIAIEDIEKSIRDVEEAGGKVLGDPMEIPGIGRYVSFMDTEGNRCSMLQGEPEAENPA